MQARHDELREAGREKDSGTGIESAGDVETEMEGGGAFLSTIVA